MGHSWLDSRAGAFQWPEIQSWSIAHRAGHRWMECVVAMPLYVRMKTVPWMSLSTTCENTVQHMRWERHMWSIKLPMQVHHRICSVHLCFELAGSLRVHKCNCHQSYNRRVPQYHSMHPGTSLALAYSISLSWFQFHASYFGVNQITVSTNRAMVSTCG